MKKMKFPHRTFKNKIFLLYFFSYMFVIIMTFMFIATLSYQLFKNTVETEITKANKNSLKQISHSINDLLYDVNTVSVYMGLDSRLSSYAQDTESHFLLNHIKDNLRMITDSKREIHSVDIYFENNNTVLSSAGVLRTYRNDIKDDWIIEIAKTENDHLWTNTREITNYDGQIEKVVTLSRKFPVSYSEKSGYIAININEQSFVNIMKELEYDDNMNVYIINQQGNQIASFEQHEELDNKLYLEKIMSGGEEGSFIDRDSEQSSLTSFITISNSDWLLVSNVPLTYLDERLAYIKNATILICVFLTIIGALVSYFLSKSMYSPIRILLDKTKRYKNALALNVTNNEMNDFTFMATVLDKAVIKNKSLQGKIDKNIPIVRENFLHSLLNNKMSSRDEIRQSMDSLDLHFSMKNYTVIILEIDDYAQLTENYPTEKMLINRYALKNIVEEIFVSHYKCVCILLNEKQQLLLVNLDDDDIKDSQKYIEELSAQVQKVLFDLFNLSITIGVGGIYKDISQVSLSYHEAKNIIKQKMIKGNKQIMFFDEIQSEHNLYYYPVQLERNYINSVKSGNEANVVENLIEIRDEIKLKKTLSIENIYRLYSRLLEGAVQYVMEREGSLQHIFQDKFMIYQELSKRETLDSIHEWMVFVSTKIALYIYEEKQITYKTHVDKVLEFMDQNFCEDLSIEEIADMVSLNPTYLSRIFKQDVGMTIVEYLTKKRLSKSKELLKSSNLTIVNVAKEIGYNNVNSYIRYFKRSEGITPGEYRKSRQ